MTARLLDLLASDTGLSSVMERVRSALRASDFAAAASASFEILNAQPSYLPALVALALAVQLADDQPTLDNFSLDGIRSTLVKAADIQSGADDAERELARFLFAVDDDDTAALEVVERAIAARAAQLRELLVAKVEILRDMGRGSEADRVAQDALRMFPSDAELKTTLG